MFETVKFRKESALDLINLLLAAVLFLAPWLWSFTGTTAAAWNAWISAAVIGVIALAAVFAFAPWEEWLNLALGVWVAVSPWILGFTAIASALYAHVVLGLAIAVLAAGELWLTRRVLPHATA